MDLVKAVEMIIAVMVFGGLITAAVMGGSINHWWKKKRAKWTPNAYNSKGAGGGNIRIFQLKKYGEDAMTIGVVALGQSDTDQKLAETEAAMITQMTELNSSDKALKRWRK